MFVFLWLVAQTDSQFSAQNQSVLVLQAATAVKNKVFFSSHILKSRINPQNLHVS